MNPFEFVFMTVNNLIQDGIEDLPYVSGEYLGFSTKAKAWVDVESNSIIIPAEEIDQFPELKEVSHIHRLSSPNFIVFQGYDKRIVNAVNHFFNHYGREFL